jgi:hypothetical protein
MDNVDKPVEDQEHAPFMFVSGTFTGAASRWAIAEKEAYAIVETLRRGDYLLHRPEGFDLYTDHAICSYLILLVSMPPCLSALRPNWIGWPYYLWATTIVFGT